MISSLFKLIAKKYNEGLARGFHERYVLTYKVNVSDRFIHSIRSPIVIISITYKNGQDSRAKVDGHLSLFERLWP